MTPVPDLLVQHGVALLFAWAFAVQLGVPAPASPMLLGAGVLSGAGRMDLGLAIAVAVAAALGADVLWYALGRIYGARILGILGRFSTNPDTLIRRARERLLAHRIRYVILAKFLHGVNPLVAGLAGAVALRPEGFVLCAAAGGVLWAGAWIMLGYLCSDLIGLVAARAAEFATPLMVGSGAALIAFLVFRYLRPGVAA